MIIYYVLMIISIRVQITFRNLLFQSLILQKRSLTPKKDRVLSCVTSWELLQLVLLTPKPEAFPLYVNGHLISLIDCGEARGAERESQLQ